MVEIHQVEIKDCCYNCTHSDYSYYDDFYECMKHNEIQGDITDMFLEYV